MSDDGELLLRAICADPADDTVRLAYADYLEEARRPQHAAFIREQLALPYPTGRTYPRVSGTAEFSPDSPLRFFASLWVVPAWQSVFIQRGFVASINIHPNSLLQNADILFSMQPVTLVLLQDKRPAWTRPSGSPSRQHTWWNEEKPDNRIRNSCSVLPAVLMPDPDKRRNNFGDNETALEAVSRRCVAYGREKAGLPPLQLEKAT